MFCNVCTPIRASGANVDNKPSKGNTQKDSRVGQLAREAQNEALGAPSFARNPEVATRGPAHESDKRVRNGKSEGDEQEQMVVPMSKVIINGASGQPSAQSPQNGQWKAENRPGPGSRQVGDGLEPPRPVSSQGSLDLQTLAKGLPEALAEMPEIGSLLPPSARKPSVSQGYQGAVSQSIVS